MTDNFDYLTSETQTFLIASSKTNITDYLNSIEKEMLPPPIMQSTKRLSRNKAKKNQTPACNHFI